MCGIVGFINTCKKNEKSTKEISEMIRLIKHRGSNDFGIVGVNLQDSSSVDLNFDEPLRCCADGFLGFARLSIQDLSLRGHQPMKSHDGKVIISFNGEIYNANEYKSFLMSKGIVFNSSSDTEVLLQMYLYFGIEQMPELLNGMFGISIVDLRINKLFLLRDRVGIKPLYYVVTPKRFAYSSEIKSFLALEDFERCLDEERLVENLTFFKPTNNILFKNVKMVCPGELLIINLNEFSIHTKKFFSIDNYDRPNDSKENMEEWKEKTKEVIYRCVEKQKISDAKIGCQLSGGVDSSLVTYFAAKSGVNVLKDSISIIFDGNEKEYSEEKFVDIVGQRTHISTHKKIIDVNYVINNYEKTLWHADTVIGRPNSLGLLLLTEEAKKYVTVLLSGEGSDELFGGYAMFTQGKKIREQLLDTPIIVETVKNQPEIIHNFAEYVVISQQKTNTNLLKDIFPEYNGQKLIKERIEYFHSFHGTDFDKQIKYTISTYLPELLLCQDKMSMANSIENRVPILDNELIDLAFSIPEKYLISKKKENWEGKSVLKEICSDIFGEDFSYRRKMGFGLPYYRYFKDRRFKEYFYDVVLTGTRKRGLFRSEILENWYKNLENNSWGECELFWKVCSFEVWCQLFLDRRKIISEM